MRCMKAVCCMIATVAIVAMANSDLPEEVTDLGGLPSLTGDAGVVAPAKEAKQILAGQASTTALKAFATVGPEDGLAAERLVQVAEGAKVRAGSASRRRARRVRSFTVKFSVISGGDAIMALSRHRTPLKGRNRSYEIRVGGADGRVCIRAELGGKDKSCGSLGSGKGKLLWKKDKTAADSKSGSKMWAKRHKYSTNFQLTRAQGKITIFVMEGGKKREVVSWTDDKPIDSRYISVATNGKYSASWTVCSYRCVRGIYTTAGLKVFKPAGHLERYISEPWSYWRSEFYPELDKSFGATEKVDFAIGGNVAGKSLMDRVVTHINGRTPWTKLNGYKYRLHTLSFSGTSKVWKALDKYKYNLGEQLGAKGASHLYTSKWAATFEAKLRIPKTETYLLYSWADDGVKMSVDGVMKHESGGIKNDMKWKVSSKSISAGTRKMRIDYYQNAGTQGLWAMWSTKTDAGSKGKCGSNTLNEKTCSKAFITIPNRIGGGVGPTDFSKCRKYGGSLTVRAWKHIGKPRNVHQAMQFTQKRPTKFFLANSIYFENTASYFSGLDAGFTKEFAVRADGFFKAKWSGEYKFWLVSDDGSQFWIDTRNFLNSNIPVTVDNDGNHAIQGIAPWQEKAKTVKLTKGYYRISAFMYDKAGKADFEMYVQTPRDNGPRNLNCRDLTKSPMESTAKFAYVGCFADNVDGKKRDLPIRKGSSGVSINTCSSQCEGYKYFGRQGKRECWCGNSYGTQSIPAGAKDYPNQKTAGVNYNPKSCDCRSRGMSVKGRQCVYEQIIAGSKNIAFGMRAASSNAPKPTAAWRAVDGLTNHGIMKNADGGMSDSRSMACTIIKPKPGKSSWWRVDFGENRRVQSFSVTGVSDGTAAMSNGLTARVGGWMNDGKSDAVCVRGFNAFKGTHFKACSAHLSGRYFSLWGMGDSQMVLCEVRVYGDQQDLAFNKKTTQSSESKSGVSKHAVDGNTNGVFANKSCTHTKKGKNPWWRVDLGSTATVDTVTIWNRSDGGERRQQFEVRVGNDAKTYSGNGRCGGLHKMPKTADGVQGTKAVACGKKTGRYVFIDIPANEATLTLCEVRVSGSHVTENISKGRPCAQSSGTNCGKALDGNINGNMAAGSCSSTTKQDPAWWYVDLQDEYKVSEVHVYGRTDCCGDRLSNFQVRVGDTRPTSGTIKMNKACNSKTNGGKNDFNMFNVENPAKPSLIVKCHRALGQYVSINIPDRRDYLSLCEVKVFGSKSGKVRTNIARGKKTKQSSTSQGGLSSRAVDGTTDNSGQNSCTHTSAEKKSWWQVDLGKNYEVSKVVLYNCEAGKGSVRVRVGDFGSNAVAKNSPCGAPFNPKISRNSENIINCQKQQGRYVTVDTFDADQSVLSLCEVKVYGEAVSDGLALHKPTSQSSTTSGGYSKRAVDGNTDGDFSKGSCTATMKENNPFWYVDLQKKASVHKVRIYNRSDCCGERIRNFEVRVGNTRPTSSTFSSNPKCGGLHWGDAASKGGGQLTVPCGNNGVIGQYVSIVLPGKKRVLTLCEVKVTGQFVTKAYSQCQSKMKGVAAELLRAQFQYKAIQKDMGKLNGDHTKVKKDLSKVKASEKKAKADILAARGAGAKALRKAQAAHKSQMTAKAKQQAALKQQVALEKKATRRMAGKAEQAAKAHAATHKKCTAQRLKNAAEMKALKKGVGKKDVECVKTAKREKAKFEKKYGALSKKHASHKSAATRERQRAAGELSSLRKQCKQKEADARDAGRKAGLKACPGVNGLMREIWRLRQKLGKKAAGRL